jgi:hypothetical protein
MRGALATILLVLALGAAPASAASLRVVGSGPSPVRAFDERFAVVARTPDVISIWSDLGPTRSRDLPAGCETRDLRFPRLVLACDEEGRTERPVVLDVVSGARSAPPLPPPELSSADRFRLAGRHWLLGLRGDAGVADAPVAIILNRGTGEVVEVTGTPDLDAPDVRVDPAMGASVPCGPELRRVRRAIYVVGLDCRPVRKVGGSGSFAVTSSGHFGAFAEGGRLRLVSLASARVVRSWALPPGPRAGMRIALTRRHVFASVPAAGGWTTYEAET